jgi:hypothetical protein
MTAKYKVQTSVTPREFTVPLFFHFVAPYASGERAAYGYPFESLSRGLGIFADSAVTDLTNKFHFTTL